MDYTKSLQNNLSTSNDIFFAGAITKGVGAEPEDFNPDASESLHSDDQSISWVAEAQINSVEKPGYPAETATDSKLSHGQEQLAVITSTTSENYSGNTYGGRLEENGIVTKNEYDGLKIVGDKIDTEVIKKAENIEKKMLDNNDAAGYVDAIRDENFGLSPIIMSNSFEDNSGWNDQGKTSGKTIQFPGAGSVSRNVSGRKAA